MQKQTNICRSNASIISNNLNISLKNSWGSIGISMMGWLLLIRLRIIWKKLMKLFVILRSSAKIREKIKAIIWLHSREHLRRRLWELSSTSRSLLSRLLISKWPRSKLISWGKRTLTYMRWHQNYRKTLLNPIK